MTTFAYTSGDPGNLVGGSPASMSDISGPFDDIETFLNGNVSDVNIAANGVDNDNLDATTIAAKLGLSQTGTVRRGKSIITTEQSRTDTAYGLLTTADVVEDVVLPTDGLLGVGFQGMWKSSVAGAGRAAIFIGANQLKVALSSGTAPTVQEASTSDPSGFGSRYVPLATASAGLVCGPNASSDYTGDVTTGQILGVGSSIAGPIILFAAAGTYDISVQFKSTSGSVTVKNRSLWVWTLGF